VSAKGVRIDSSWVESILTLALPRSKKEVQSFLGKVNFLRGFLSNFVELLKYIIAMLRKDNEIKWNVDARIYFDEINKALMEAPVLVILDYSKVFVIFSFASFDTVETILLQKNSEGLEQPIAFFSRAFRDA
jgi:hypothetical protein